MGVSAEARAWVARAVGHPVVRARRMDGASSTAVHVVHLGNGAALVLRRYLWRGFLDAEPEAPGREVDALRHAAASGLPVPEIVAEDATGDSVGDGVPTILMTLLPGRPVHDADPGALAEVAVQIHEVDCAGLAHAYFPWYEAEMTTPPPTSTQPRLWERAISLWQDGPPPFEPTFIHRDLHPGNVLWRRRIPTGIVDWSNACCGPRGCDLAHCRSNVRQWAGAEAAASFVAAYTALTDRALDPFWIMASVLEHGHDHWTAESLAPAEADLAAAVDQLG